MNRLDGKVALISGAARGIGGETARLMVEAGATVAIGDVLDERGRETARTLGNAALYVHLDVTREEDWNAAVAAALGRFGKLDILVNNAGLFLGKDVEAASLAEWERLCAVNLTGVFLGTKLCLPALRRGGAAEPSRERHRQPRLDRRPRRFDARPALLDDQRRGDAIHKICRAGICPQGIPHSGQLNAPGHDRHRYGRPGAGHAGAQLGTNDIEAARRQVIERLPIGRMGTPNDIAKGIVFLASDDAAFMTGAGLVIDGGITAQ